MEKRVRGNEKILCFGDSLTRGYAPLLKECAAKRFSDGRYTFIEAGVGGETSRDGCARIKKYTDHDVAIIGFGMNDPNANITDEEYESNMRTMIEYSESIDARVLLLTLNPTNIACDDRSFRYSRIMRNLAREYCVRLVDIYRAWGTHFGDYRTGLTDGVHPNDEGNKLYVQEILKVLPRRARIALWQYNGNPAECNYVCPYCSYDPRTQSGHHFKRTIAEWYDAFKKTFKNQNLILYFGHGEPMHGEKWLDVVEMIGSEKKWEMRVITNLSLPLDRLLASAVATSGRLNINASFHPTMISREDFLAQLDMCRNAGIEVPVVYTLWPPFFERFHDDLEFFTSRGYFVHIRRFRGIFKGQMYPAAYTEEERRTVARYADSATIKYMLSNELTSDEYTWDGVDFMIIDNEGNVGYCDDYPTQLFSFGNAFDDSVRFLLTPNKFPKENVSDGTVDGVACLLKLGYEQLEGNHIMHFSRLGGVYQDKGKMVFGNYDLDFDDPRVRAEYHFPPRDMVDADYIYKCPSRSIDSKMRSIAHMIR
jgi:lysophospholipase L1-like esterase